MLIYKVVESGSLWKHPLVQKYLIQYMGLLDSSEQIEPQEMAELIKVRGQMMHQGHTMIYITIQWSLIYPSGPHLSGHMFGNQFTFVTESYSLYLKFSYMDNQIGKRGVWMNEAPLYLLHLKICVTIQRYVSQYIIY